MRPFFEEPSDFRGSRASLRSTAKYAAASFYAIPGAAIFCILMIALFRNGTDRLSHWLSSHVAGVLGGLFILAYGLVALLQPDIVLRWIGSAYSDYNLDHRNPSVRYFIRGLGACVAAFGLYIFMRL